jgi:hypothetical protein
MTRKELFTTVLFTTEMKSVEENHSIDLPHLGGHKFDCENSMRRTPLASCSFFSLPLLSD